MGASGCLLDFGPINKRPSVQINEHEPLHRGETVIFAAAIIDPDEKTETLTVDWHVGDSCDAASRTPPLSCESNVTCSYNVPAQAPDSLCVVVTVTDRYTASASDSRVFEVENRAPWADIKRTAPLTSTSGSSSFPLLTSFEFSGEASDDPDPGDKTRLVYTWRVTLNGQGLSYPKCADASRPWICAFTAQDPGSYRISLTVKDPGQKASAPASLDLDVADDSPPCIVDYDPSSLEPVRFAAQKNTFAVRAVKDDVNPYPSPNAGTFRWSYRRGLTGEFSRYSVSSNRLDFDEGSFRIGDQIQIRVEYQDDKHRSLLSCDTNKPLCSLNNDGCVQWITWTVTFL